MHLLDGVWECIITSPRARASEHVRADWRASTYLVFIKILLGALELDEVVTRAWFAWANSQFAELACEKSCTHQRS
jgi:hypothetical protein